MLAYFENNIFLKIVKIVCQFVRFEIWGLQMLTLPDILSSHLFWLWQMVSTKNLRFGLQELCGTVFFKEAIFVALLQFFLYWCSVADTTVPVQNWKKTCLTFQDTLKTWKNWNEQKIFFRIANFALQILSFFEETKQEKVKKKNIEINLVINEF
jgi:hypothetical protein